MRLTFTGTRPATSSSRIVVSKEQPSLYFFCARWMAQPIVGWPAKGISAVGKKMRTLAVLAASAAVRTKIVSDRLNSRAMVCICSVVSPSACSTMASGLPA